MSDYELDLTHAEQDYILHLDLDWVYDDESFDGHLGGRVHTFKRGHWIVGDYRVVMCLLIGEDDSDQVEPDDINGLSDAICDKVNALSKEDHDCE